MINVAKDASVISEQVAAGFSEFFDSYERAVKASNVDDAEKVALRVMAMVAGKTLEQFVQPYEFEPFHEVRMSKGKGASAGLPGPDETANGLIACLPFSLFPSLARRRPSASRMTTTSLARPMCLSSSTLKRASWPA